MKISEDIIYIGANDKDIDLFESQYNVPNGISYNSYIIKDEQIVIMDTIDKRKTTKWLENLERALEGNEPDYLVVSHLEPDHAYNVELLARKYPTMKIVGNNKTFAFMPQFFDIADFEERKVLVKEGDTLNIGKHTLQFFMAPMVHWPEVMVTYEQTEKILFSADAFGKFGCIEVEEGWKSEEDLNEARRYYINIVGKYGIQVQAALKKMLTLDIKTICPLHGPILKENLQYYIDKYNTWSSYTPEEDGILIAYASIHGNTANAANKLAEILKQNGHNNICIKDLARCDFAEAISEAFKYSKVVLAASTYNMGIFPPMANFLNRLKGLNYQNRTVAIIENGTWAPNSGKCMKDILSEMKDINIVEPVITIKSKLNEKTLEEFGDLAKKL